MNEVMRNVAYAREDGARPSCGGKRMPEGTGGYFVKPTIFDNVSPRMRLAHEEIFRAALAVMTCDTPEQAVASADGTEQYPAASISTGPCKTGHAGARAIRAGLVSVNCYGEGAVTRPFGGFRLSSFVGPDIPLAAHNRYCETRQ